MNGYPSNAFAARTMFTTIHITITAIKLKINAQLPANLATASDAFCPSDSFSSLSVFFVTSVAIS